MSYTAMLDTNIVSGLMREGPGRLWQRVERYGVGNICVSIISVCELRFGAELRSSQRLNDEVTDILSVIASVPFADPAADTYSRIRAHLAKAGTPIGPNDLFIAAHALALDVTLVTANLGEFSRVPGLSVENWLD